MRASDLLRDLLEPGTPANAANAANHRASTAFAGLRTPANGCESAADDVSHSQNSQPFASAESKQPCGLSQDSQHSQADGLRNPSAPCEHCGCGSYWHAADGWHCEGCNPPSGHVERWLQVSGGKLAPLPPPAVAWPPELTADLRRVSAAFEWTRQDIADFCRWARRSPEALARAGEFLRAELAKLPPPGVVERRRTVLAMLADDPALRVAWTCADDGESDPVLLTLAIRGRGACELAIPRTKFDAFALLRSVERHSELAMANNHHPRRAP